jgi:hypothetical protein
MFMRVNSKCAHQVRPPLARTRGGQRSVNPARQVEGNERRGLRGGPLRGSRMCLYSWAARSMRTSREVGSECCVTAGTPSRCVAPDA